MKLKIVVIDLELSRRSKRIALALLAGGLLVGAGAVASARVAHTWTDGETLSATDLNGAFAGLDERLTALEDKEHVVRASIAGNGAISAQTGSWISLVNHASAGSYEMTFTSGIFSATPSCVATVHAGNQVPPDVECYNASATALTCVISASGSGAWAPAPLDSGWDLICVGP